MVRKALSDKRHLYILIFLFLTSIHCVHYFSMKEDRRQEEKKFILLKWCCMTLAISEGCSSL